MCLNHSYSVQKINSEETVTIATHGFAIGNCFYATQDCHFNAEDYFALLEYKKSHLSMEENEISTELISESNKPAKSSSFY